MTGTQRILAGMIAEASGGLVSISYKRMTEVSGVNARGVGYCVKRMLLTGVIEVVKRGGPQATSQYRILQPEHAGISLEAWSVERVALLKTRRAEKDTAAVLAALNALPGSALTPTAMRKKASKLWGQKRGAHGAAPTPKAPPREKPIVLKTTPPPLYRSTGSRSPSGMAQASVGSFGWSIGALPKLPARRGGACCWPLTCDNPADGNWCAHHAAMLGKRRRGPELLAAE